MKTQTGRQPRAGEIVMICAHARAHGATLRGAHLIKIPGGPQVFSNLDDRFFAGWLYFCDDCHAKASADIRESAGLIHGPMEWIGDLEGVPDRAVEAG
jgi:hypothetical protein